jgi:pimeloyl-ACP methyl ester carboxylesterase
VPFDHGRAIAEAWPGARFVPLEHLGHTRPLADTEVLRAAVAFLREGMPAAAVVPAEKSTSG